MGLRNLLRPRPLSLSSTHSPPLPLLRISGHVRTTTRATSTLFLSLVHHTTWQRRPLRGPWPLSYRSLCSLVPGCLLPLNPYNLRMTLCPPQRASPGRV